MKPKHLVMPALSDAVELRPMELNNIRFSAKHTVLTPELLEQMSKQKPATETAKPQETASASVVKTNS